MTYLRRMQIEIANTPSADAFGRLRISEPFTIFDSKQLHDSQSLLWDQELFVNATATHSASDARTRLATTGTGDAAIRQTFMRFDYQSGKSQQVMMTFYSPLETNVRKRIGLYHTSNAANSAPQNGFFLAQDGSSVYLQIAKNGSITENTAQASWNVDPLNGTGASGLALDFAAVQLMMIDFSWLGTGDVRFLFKIDGVWYTAHIFKHANDNAFTSVYTSTPNLPLGYAIYQSGVGTGTLDHICSSVSSEGGRQKSGVMRSINNGSTSILIASNTNTAALGIKLRTGFEDSTVQPISFSVISNSGTSKFFLAQLVFNPTVTNTFTYGNLTGSSIQYATGVNTNIASGGTVLFSIYGESAGVAQLDLDVIPRLGAAIDGTLDSLVLSIMPLGTSMDMFTSLSWGEI